MQNLPAEQESAGFRIVLDDFSELKYLIDCRLIGFSIKGEEIIFSVLQRLRGTLCHWCPASWAESRFLLERCLALWTLLESRSTCISFVHHIIVGSDLLIHLFICHTRVRLELTRILHPVRSMFDDLFGEPLANPTGTTQNYCIVGETIAAIS